MNKTANSFRQCPLCKKDHPILFAQATTAPPKSSHQIQVTDKYFGLHGDLVKCANCGFSYVGNRAYAQKIASLYKDMRDEVYLSEEEERKKSFINVLKMVEKLRRNKKGKILDIGCCTGRLLAEAQNRGWQPYGVEPSKWACKIGKELHNLSFYNNYLEDWKSSAKRFDLITILDLLEHLEDPVKVLRRVHQLLKDDGTVCIVTPDYASNTARLFGRKWWGIRLAHISYFRLVDLQRLSQQTGFIIIKRKTYTRYFSLYYILVRFFPTIEERNLLKFMLKHITIPLLLFDTFELYLKKY